MENHPRIQPPHDLFLHALPFISQWNNIIDIGGGYLNETRYLLERGYPVTVLDRNPLPEVLIPKITANLTYLQTDFHHYVYLPRHYNFVISLFSLSFTDPQSFPTFFSNVVKSIARNGVFVGNVFSNNDDWCKQHIPKITFLTKTELEKFFGCEFEMIECLEKEWDGPKYDGAIKHWHTVDFIARRRL